MAFKFRSIFRIVLIVAVYCQQINGEKNAHGNIETVASSLHNLNSKGSAVLGLIEGALSEGFIELIQTGKDLAGMFGLGKVERGIFIENLCKECNVQVHCKSEGKDFGSVPLLFKDDLAEDKQLTKIVIKFNDLGIGLAHWTCIFKNDANHREIDIDTFGGEAPKDVENYYQVRKRGVYRIDKATGRIDARQPIHFWPNH